jgi:hypothetical protein
MGNILTFVATIAVAIISLIGIVIQNKSKEKAEIIDLKLNNIDKKFVAKTDKFEQKLEQLRDESKKADEEISNKINIGKYYMLKVWLTNELTKVLNGAFVPSEEQKKMIKEAFDEYSKAGGNSFVKDMYIEAKEKGLL